MKSTFLPYLGFLKPARPQIVQLWFCLKIGITDELVATTSDGARDPVQPQTNFCNAPSYPSPGGVKSVSWLEPRSSIQRGPKLPNSRVIEPSELAVPRLGASTLGTPSRGTTSSQVQSRWSWGVQDFFK